MAETMRVILDNFWSWLGTFLIVAVLAEGLGSSIRIVVNRERTDGPR